MAPEPVLTPEDDAVLERLARRIAELRLETPAILALETARPLTLVASQSLVFFEPFVQSLFGFGDYRRWTELAGRRDALDALVRRIEQAAVERAAARREAGSSR